MSNEAYRMSLVGMKTIDLSQLIIETSRLIDKHKEMKVATKHSDTNEYLFHHREMKRYKQLITIQRDELRSRQMKTWD